MLEHFYEIVSVSNTSAVLITSIFRCGDISIPEAKRNLKERAIPVET
jgi:imidazole glycerol phosphate synthase subunit HisF